MSYSLDIFIMRWRGVFTSTIIDVLSEDETGTLNVILEHFPNTLSTHDVYTPACTDDSCEQCSSFSRDGMIPFDEYRCGETEVFARFTFQNESDLTAARLLL